jgi:hypothetical protein
MEKVLVMSLPVVRVTPIDTTVIKAAAFQIVNTIVRDCIVFMKKTICCSRKRIRLLRDSSAASLRKVS